MGMLGALCGSDKDCIAELWQKCGQKPKCVQDIWRLRQEDGKVSEQQVCLLFWVSEIRISG